MNNGKKCISAFLVGLKRAFLIIFLVIKTADTGEISVDSTFVKVHQPALIGKPIKINL